MNRDRMEKLVDALGVDDKRLPRPDIDPADIGKLNPARLNPDSPSPSLPPIHGTYKRVDPTSPTGREIDTGIPFTVTKWGADGRPAEVRPVIDTPQAKLNWDTYQEMVAKGAQSLGHRLQRAEVKRVLDKDKAEHHADGDRRDEAIRQSYLTQAERDIDFENKALAGAASARLDRMTPQAQVEHAQALAAKIGLELAYIPMGTVYQDDPEHPGQVVAVEERTFIARHAWGTMYGPTTLAELCKRLEIDVRERERQAAMVALADEHARTIAQATVTSVWVNDRMVQASA